MRFKNYCDGNGDCNNDGVNDDDCGNNGNDDDDDDCDYCYDVDNDDNGHGDGGDEGGGDDDGGDGDGAGDDSCGFDNCNDCCDCCNHGSKLHKWFNFNVKLDCGIFKKLNFKRKVYQTCSLLHCHCLHKTKFDRSKQTLNPKP